jgi:predicted ABC-type ATPase
MIVVGGPPGSGKSTVFPVRSFGLDAFNIDERCRELHGSYQGIPPRIRKEASLECERFIEHHIESRTGFAIETTMRTSIAIEQAIAARKSGFSTTLFFLSTEDPAIQIRRIIARSFGGGHAAPEIEIRATYDASLSNLPKALTTFDLVECFDTTVHGVTPRWVATARNGVIRTQKEPTPLWLRNAIAALHNHPCSR